MEFTISTHVYRAGKLNAFDQLYVIKRLTPMLGKLASLAGSNIKLTKGADGKATDLDGDITTIITPLTEAITALPDADMDFVINTCLAACERKQPGGGWAPVRKGEATMYEVSLSAMLTITYRVVRNNLSDFLADLPSLSILEGLVGKVASPG